MTTKLAHHTSGPDTGRLVVLLPGAGDIRSENRFLEAALAGAGYRVLSADLPGHGDSAPAASYGVEETAAALVELIEGIDAGPAVVVGVSFAPAAAVWAAATHPDLISGVVAISPHFEADTSLKGRLQSGSIHLLLRGNWAGGIWEKLYRSWYKASTPDDMDTEVARIRQMLADPDQRKAVRHTLTAHRAGVAERMTEVKAPVLVVFGSADDHFADPTAEAASVADRLDAEVVMVEGAGHYPHVERPDIVGPAVVEFVDRLPA